MIMVMMMVMMMMMMMMMIILGLIWVCLICKGDIGGELHQHFNAWWGFHNIFYTCKV